jgi:glyoxylase-like metal-dependent hydrolase (beta-lactamase superfamily II)
LTRAQTAPPELKLESVGTHLSVLSGAGGNIALLAAPDGLLMVDSGLPETASAMMAQAKSAAPKIAILINTHWHYDHTGGNPAVGASGARLIAHINVKKRLSTTQKIVALNREFPPIAPEGLPVETFADKSQLTYAGEKVHYERLQPAHTDGDTIVHFLNANVMHCGDLYFNGFYPFIDYSSGGSIEGMIANAARILKIVDAKTVVIPGHGPVSNKKELAEFHEVLAGANKSVSKLIQEGKSLPEIVAAKPLSKWDSKWGQGFMKPEQFIGLLYQGKKGSQAS